MVILFYFNQCKFSSKHESIKLAYTQVWLQIVLNLQIDEPENATFDSQWYVNAY